jgi:hypothetical protein
MGSFANKWIDKNRSALGEKRYFHTAGSDQYQFLLDYGRDKGHAAAGIKGFRKGRVLH